MAGFLNLTSILIAALLISGIYAADDEEETTTTTMETTTARDGIYCFKGFHNNTIAHKAMIFNNSMTNPDAQRVLLQIARGSSKCYGQCVIMEFTRGEFEVVYGRCASECVPQVRVDMREYTRLPEWSNVHAKVTISCCNKDMCNSPKAAEEDKEKRRQEAAKREAELDEHVEEFETTSKASPAAENSYNSLGLIVALYFVEVALPINSL